MIDEILAKRYADAFLRYASETIGFERGLKELQDAKRILRDNPSLMDFLSVLQITGAEKSAVIDSVIRDGFSDEIRNFLKLLVKKARINKFIDICEYARVKYTHGVEVNAVLKTSYPLETDVIQRLKDALQKRLNKSVHLYVELDADLLGGVYFKIGNMIIDGSVRRRLEDIREKLTALKVV